MQKGRTVERRQPLNLDPLVYNKTTAPLLPWWLASYRNGVLGGRTKTAIRKRHGAGWGKGSGTIVTTQPVFV